MAAKKIRITYIDGRVEDVMASPRAQVMTEEYCEGFGPKKAILATFYLGWASLNRAGRESRDFETWLDLIDDVVNAPDSSGDPTQPAPSGDDSSD